MTPRNWPLTHLLTLILLPVALYLPEWLGLISSDPMMTSSQTIMNTPPFRTGGLLPGNPGWIDGCAGVIVEALGKLVAHDWMHGIIPWWNPYSGVGMPLAGEYQPAAFFLPFVLLLGLPNGLLLMKCSLQIIAGLSSYAFFNRLTINRNAALIGSLLYAFNGTYAWASDGPSEPLAFLPLALYGIERARTVNNQPASWGWLALGLGYLLLSGFPETAFLLGLLVLTWASVRFFQSHDKPAYTVRIILGGLTAGLLAAPQLIAFLTFLPHADIGSHAGLNEDALPHQAWSMLLFPYLNGPFFYGDEFDSWYALGGYCGLALPLLALMSIGGKTERPLRLTLIALIITIIGKQAELPLLTSIIDHIPGASRTVFYRLCEPVVEASLIILATLTLHDLTQTTPRRKTLLLSTLTLAILALIALKLDRPLIAHLHSVHLGPVSSRQYLFGSLLFGALCLTLTVIALFRRSPRLAGAILLTESLTLFAFPLLSAKQSQPLDTALITALRQETGLQRFATLGPIEPNYGAALGIASINHNAIPTPAHWINRLRHDFGTKVDPVTFNGSFPENENAEPFLQSPLINTPERFAALGVSTIVVPHNFHFTGPAPYPLKDRHPDGTPLTPANPTMILNTATWSLTPTQTVFLQLGTYLGQSDGTLTLSFCRDTTCATGSIPLKNAQDNGFTTLTLNQPIPENAQTLTLRIENATHPLMVWTSTKDGTAWPRIRLEARAMNTIITPVLQASAGDLYRLKNPAPYFETETPCTLTIQNRETLTTTCPTPTHLIRREIMLPGWTATLNGQTLTPETQDNLFERLPLPAGKSEIHFHFAPPGSTFGWIGLLLGLISLTFGLIRQSKPYVSNHSQNERFKNV